MQRSLLKFSLLYFTLQLQPRAELSRLSLVSLSWVTAPLGPRCGMYLRTPKCLALALASFRRNMTQKTGWPFTSVGVDGSRFLDSVNKVSSLLARLMQIILAGMGWDVSDFPFYDSDSFPKHVLLYHTVQSSSTVAVVESGYFPRLNLFLNRLRLLYKSVVGLGTDQQASDVEMRI